MSLLITSITRNGYSETVLFSIYKLTIPAMNNKEIPNRDTGGHDSLKLNNRKKNENIRTNHKLIMTINGEQYRMPICNKYIGSITPVAVTVIIQPIFPEK